VQKYNRTCCPDVPGLGVCGGQNRGRCETITNDYPMYDCTQNKETRYCMAEELLRTRAKSPPVIDLRYKWPAQIFDRVCKCNKEYSGFNCMRCNRGYKINGSSCVKVNYDKEPPPKRKNFLKLKKDEQDEFMDILEMAKSSIIHGIEYAVPIQQPIVDKYSFVSVSLYDSFTTYHYYTNRDKPLTTKNSNDVCYNSYLRRTCDKNECLPDFAHWGPAFLTWHRGYLLYFENEIRYMLSQMDRTGKFYTADNFALHYWDWTDVRNRDKIWSIIEQFDEWKVVCGNHKDDLCTGDEEKLCDPSTVMNKIERKRGGTSGKQCLARASDNVDYSSPSNGNDVEKALKESFFDKHPYWYEEDNGGLRNALEGFAKLASNREGVCNNLQENERPVWRFFELHNRLHVYVGGTMSDIVISSNDPLFYLHHSNVDRMYEMWLQKHNETPYEPRSFSYEVAPGHNLHESLIMLFPTITNENMHKTSDTLGYEYCRGLGIHNNVYKVTIGSCWLISSQFNYTFVNTMPSMHPVQ